MEPDEPRVTVRPFGRDEWRAYRDLRTRALQDAPTAFASTYEDALRRPAAEWETRLARATELDLPLVATVGEIPAGLAWGRIEPDDPTTAQLYQMWVAPEHRRRGLARMLLLAVLDWAAHEHVERVRLGVTVGNDAATCLYRSTGFAATGEREPLRPGSTHEVQTMELHLHERTAR